MMQLNITVSIVIGCFNHSNYIVESLNSIKAQQNISLQLIIFDDASTDNSAEIIQNWLNENVEISAVFLMHTTNKGRHNCLKEAVKYVRGKYLLFFSTDDVLIPNKLSILVEQLNQLGDDYAMVYGDTVMVNNQTMVIKPSMLREFNINKNELPNGYIYTELVKHFFFYIQSTLIRTTLFNKVQYQFLSTIISEDWDIQLYLSKHFKVAGVKDFISYYRFLDDSVTRKIESDSKRPIMIKSHFDMMLLHYRDNITLRLPTSELFEKLMEQFTFLYQSSHFAKAQKFSLILNLLLRLQFVHKFRFINRLFRFI